MRLNGDLSGLLDDSPEIPPSIIIIIIITKEVFVSVQIMF